MTFILNEFEIETAQIKAADDIHRPNLQAAVLTLARLMEWTNSNSDGWAYWKKPVAAATKIQVLVRDYSHYDFEKGDIPARDLKAAYTPIKSFLTRQGVDHSVIFVNG
jgi:hypothetical protein